MSTVRIQVRRGLASEWTTANPVLAAGEMGVETNTNKFKFGNGTDAWTALSYAASDSEAIGEISQDAINTALTMGAGLTKTYNDGANTITITVDTDVVATKAFATSEASTRATAAQTAAEAYTDSAINGVNSSLEDYIPASDRGAANGVASLDSNLKIPVEQLKLDNLSANITTSGNLQADNVTVGGNLVVNGTTTTLNTQNFTVEDTLLYIGSENQSSQLDLGFVAAHNTGTYNHTGLVRDASDNKWKLFKDVTDEPTTTVNFAQANLDNLALFNLDSNEINSVNLTVTGVATLPANAILPTNIVSAAITAEKLATDAVENVKIKDGAVNASKIEADSVITSKIQDSAVTAAKVANNAVTEDKIAVNAVTDGKIATDAVTEGKIANNAVTGQKIAAGAITETKIVNSAVTTDKIADLAITNGKVADGALTVSKIADLGTSLEALAPIASPTFTGTVVLPSTTSIGDLTSTEIGYLDGITSSVQTQIGAAATALSSHESSTTNVHGIADIELLATKSYADQAETDAIAAAGTAADGKISTAVAALTSSSVGLANVDNTSDADKPVSTATQTALDLKAPIAAPSFTGDANFESNVTIEGNLTVEGTTTTVNTSEVQINDPLFYLAANQYDTNTRDIGITGAYGEVGGTEQNHLHTGLVKDVTDGKWKLFSNTPHPVNNVVDFTSAAYDTLKLGSLEATTVTPSSGIVFPDKTQTKAGVPSLTTIATEVSSNTSLDALGTDAAVRDSLVPLSGAVNVSFEATGNAKYEIGSSINFYQSSGTGANITGSGVTILATPGATLRTTNSSVTATKVAATTWLLAGDLRA